MQESQVETQDVVGSIPENKNTTVTTAGTPVTVNRTDGKDCTAVYVGNPSKGTRANDINDVLYVSFDGQAPTGNGVTLARGESISVSGKIAVGSLKIDSNANGTVAEIVLEG